MIWSRTGGAESGPLLVLLPGLGATAEVFTGVDQVLADSWPGGWLAMDLPGHGRSAWDPPYTFAGHAEAVRSLLPHDRDLVLLGASRLVGQARSLRRAATWRRWVSQKSKDLAQLSTSG